MAAAQMFTILGQGYNFSEIQDHLVPSPSFSNWQDSVKVGLSPRSTQRLRMGITLPLPDAPLVSQFILWRPQPSKFCFHLMNLIDWMGLTGSNPRMVDDALKTTGMPPSFGNFNSHLLPYLNHFAFRASLHTQQHGRRQPSRQIQGSRT